MASRAIVRLRFTLLAAISLAGAASYAQELTSEPGQFEVPEDRTAASSRRIVIKYVRLPATTTKARAPIVFLNGGPGSPAIPLLRGGYRPLLSALREAGDVILLDQRGTGASNAIPPCPASATADVAMTRERLIGWYRSELPRCRQWWERQGVALRGYTTLQNAADLEDLRKHLGVARLNLFGISYGTHLAQAAVKYHPTSFERIALAGLEGLDQTVKRPARIDLVLERVAALIAADPAVSSVYPDLLGTMRRVHERLNREPVRVRLRLISGDEREIAVDGFALQIIVGQFLRSTAGLANLPAFYRKLDRGDYSSIPLVFPRGADYPPMMGMPEAMDLASGISAARAEMVEREAKSAVVGDALNFPIFHLRSAFPEIDLGDAFREPMRTGVPSLLIAGDLDGRTPLEEQREAGAQFTRAHWIVVENAAHDVLLSTPELSDRLVRFFNNEVLPVSETLRIPAPRFTLPQ